MTKNWLRLIYKKGFSLNQKRFLVENLGSPEAVTGASVKELSAVLQRADFLQRKVGPGPEFTIVESRAVTLTIERDISRMSDLGAK